MTIIDPVSELSNKDGPQNKFSVVLKMFTNMFVYKSVI